MNIITVKVKPFAAHYLRIKYPLHGNIIDLPRKSKMRNIFLACLQKNYTASDNEKVNGYTEEIQIYINEELIQQHGQFLAPAFSNLFNGVIEEKIKIEAFHIINLIRIRHKLSVKDAILEFQSMYGFDETFSFDAIKRDYYRSLNEAEEIILKKKTVTKLKPYVAKRA